VTRALSVVAATLLMATAALAGEVEVFDVGKELAGADDGRRAVNRRLVREPAYTVNAVAVNDEIPSHRHEDAGHVLYIVSGRGTALVGEERVALKPGLVVHIPKGVVHSLKADGERLTFVDFVPHASRSGAGK
jgi:quercetin dioxygenase-like cupin family protein